MLAALALLALLQAESPSCSKAEIAYIFATPVAERSAVAARMMESNPTCVICIITASRKAYPDVVYYLSACMHQNENECTDSTGLARVAPLLRNVSLQNRQSVIAMLEVAEADCVYCILESIEGACGEGCVKNALHIQVLPKAGASAPVRQCDHFIRLSLHATG